MTSGQEPVDADPDSLTREPLLVAVTHGHVAAVDDDRQQVRLARVRVQARVELDRVAE